MEIVYTALKLQPSDKLYGHSNANTRITNVFLEMLERQFPIEDPSPQFDMTNANALARQLHFDVIMYLGNWPVLFWIRSSGIWIIMFTSSCPSFVSTKTQV